jgi:polar amino acid transport system substrate-binding protein
VCLALIACASAWRPSVAHAAPQPELRWGGDAEGGAPYVEADPADPSRVVGFDVEIAQLLAAGLGRTPRFIQAGFTSIDASVARGDFDVALSGIEDSPARRARLAVTIPYYEFREVLTVRAADTAASARCPICEASASPRSARRWRTTCSSRRRPATG